MKRRRFRTFICVTVFIVAFALCASWSAGVSSAATAMTEAEVKEVSRDVYIWGWPLVNMLNRVNLMKMVPFPMYMGEIPLAPAGHVAMFYDYVTPEQKAIRCPNQDVVYGSGAFDLDRGPIVFQVPDFGDRFWLYQLYDARTDLVAGIGRQYGTRPGFHMLVGPKWRGFKPFGIKNVYRSSTRHVYAIPRIAMEDTAADRAAVKPLIDRVKFYPVWQYTGFMKCFDMTLLMPRIPTSLIALLASERFGGDGEMRWVIPGQFFDDLAEVISTVHPLAHEVSLYAEIKSLLEARKASTDVKRWMDEAAADADIELTELADTPEEYGTDAGPGWRFLHSPNWREADEVRRAIAMKGYAFANQRHESPYFFSKEDVEGDLLEGGNAYTITFSEGQLPPAKGLWSITLYDENRFFYRNALERYSIGSKNESLKYKDDGSLTLHIGPPPESETEQANWLPAPAGRFYLFIRVYWPEPEVLDGRWLPPPVVRGR